MSLSSYSKWKNKKFYLENTGFQNPNDQQNMTQNVAQPNVSQPNVTSEEPANPMEDLPTTVNMFLKRIQNKSVKDIMQAQVMVNQAFQQILNNKSKSAGKIGARNAFYNAKSTYQQ